MAKKLGILLLMMIFGVFITPMEGRACCSNNTLQDAACCASKNSKATAQKSCCKQPAKDNPDGHCKKGSCQCATILGSAIQLPEYFQSITLQDFNLNQIHYKIRHRADVSKGFLFIWLPPKIS